MQVNNTFNQPNSVFLKAASVNKNIDKANEATNSMIKKGRPNRDRVDISPQGKMMSLIETLNAQKQTIIESKNELIARTRESGKDIDSIKERLDIYAEQLEMLDAQIAEAYTQQSKAALEKAEEKKSGKQQDSGKSGEQLETEKLSALANLTDGIKQSETIASVKGKLEGEARVKEAEAKMGGIRIDALKSKRENTKDIVATEKLVVKGQKAEAAALLDRAAQAELGQAKKLGETMDSQEQDGDMEKSEENEKM